MCSTRRNHSAPSVGAIPPTSLRNPSPCSTIRSSSKLARHWARITIAGGKDDLIEDRASRMFTRALARPPTADEIRLSLLYLDTLSASRALTPEARYTDEQLWQDYAQSLFNLKDSSMSGNRPG